MLEFIISLLISLGATVSPDITEKEGLNQLEREFKITLTDEGYEDLGY